MRIILAAVGALGISLIGVSAASANPINAAVIDAAAGADSPLIKIYAGTHHFGKYPSCTHLRSYNPDTKTFIGRDGKRHSCTP